MECLHKSNADQEKPAVRPYFESQQLLDSMLQRVAQMLDSSNVYIYTMSDGQRTIELTAGIGLFKKWLGQRHEIDDTLCSKVLESRQVRVGYKFKNYIDIESFWEEEIQSVLALPLKAAGQIVGVLGVGLSSMHQVLKAEDKVHIDGVTEIIALVLQRIQPFYTAENLPSLSSKGKLQYDLIRSSFSVINKQGIFEFVVKSHENLLGYTSEELLGISVFTLIHPEDRLAIMREFQEVCASGKENIPYIVEHRFRHKEGWYMWLETTALIMRDEKGDIVGMLLGSQDVTKRKETQKALEESEEKFRLLFNHANDAICLAELDASGLPGKIIEANQVFCQLWGKLRSSIVNTAVSELMPVWEEAEFAVLRQKLMRSEDILFEITEAAGDGLSFSVEINAHSFIINNQSVVMMIGRNTSERKRVEKEMIKLERLNVIGKLAAGIGHEVRNPLTTVHGFLQMLRKREANSENREYFDIMIEELDRANGIITEFLSIAKNKEVKIEVTHLNDIVKALAPLIQADAALTKKKLQLDLREIPPVLADQKEIRQLILNLARNGLDAMNEEQDLEIATADTLHGVRLLIKDHGKGISPEVMEKLGTPFFTTKEQGTGLGLVVCYSIAEHHHTKLEVETSKEGTTFSIVLAKTVLSS